MFVGFRSWPVAVSTPFAVAAVLMAGCGTEPTHPVLEWEAPIGFHFEDGYLAATFGITLVNIWAGGQIIGDPVVIAEGFPTPVVSTFHDASGNLVLGLDEYELRVIAADPSLVAFTRTRAFGGTVTGLGSGTTVLMVGLHNPLRQLEDYGPFPVPVTVQ